MVTVKPRLKPLQSDKHRFVQWNFQHYPAKFQIRQSQNRQTLYLQNPIFLKRVRALQEERLETNHLQKILK